MNKDLFIKLINRIKSFYDYIDKAFNYLHIDFLETPLFQDSIDTILEFFKFVYGETGDDLILWWLTEEGSKVIEDNTDLTTIDSLYDYVEKHYRL